MANAVGAAVGESVESGVGAEGGQRTGSFLQTQHASFPLSPKALDNSHSSPLPMSEHVMVIVSEIATSQFSSTHPCTESGTVGCVGALGLPLLGALGLPFPFFLLGPLGLPLLGALGLPFPFFLLGPL